MRWVLVLAVGLVGCETAATYDARQCTGYGFTPGTVEHAGCVQQQGQTRAMMFIGLQRPYVAPAAVPSAAPVQTRCSRIGGTINCTSY